MKDYIEDIKLKRQKEIEFNEKEKEHLDRVIGKIETTDGQQWKRIMNAVIGFEYYR